MREVYDKNGTLINLLQDSDLIDEENIIKLRNGTMIQYLAGRVEVGDIKPITFKENFINDDVFVVLTGNWDSILGIANIYRDCIYANAYSKNNYPDIQYFLLAIGRWK